MPAALLILRCKTLTLARAGREHLFTLLVIAPMIVFGFYCILEPSFAELAGWIRGAAAQLGPGDIAAASLVLTALLVAAGLSSAVREVFSIASPDAYLDALPASAASRFTVSAAALAARNAPAWVAFTVLLGFLAPDSRTVLPLGAGALLFLEIALLQALAALVLVNAGLFRARGWFLLGGLLLAVAALARSDPLWILAAAPLAAPAALVESALARALDASTANPLSSAVRQALSVACLAGLALAAYCRLRDENRERARAALARRGRLFSGLQQRIARRQGAPFAAQLVRDLRLTLRAFSPAVRMAGAAAILSLGAAAFAVSRLPAESDWRARIALTGCAFATLSLSALTPLLVAFERPFFWVESAAGAAPDSLWKSKRAYAAAVSVPCLAAALLWAPAVADSAAEATLFLLQAAAVWLTVSTLVGALACEDLGGPVLAVLLAGLLAMGVAGFYIFLPQAWPIALLFYVYLMHHIGERAEASAARLGVSG